MARKRLRKRLLIALSGGACLSALAAVGWWYTFVVGAPQLDAAPVPASGDLRFRLEPFTSAAMGQRRSFGVILPPGYGREPHRRYPVIVLLHGGHDDARAFFDKYAITAVLDRLYAEGALQPSLVITPDGNDRRGSSPLFDPDYYDGPHGRVGTLIGAELVDVVRRRYRTSPDPAHWALGGFSSGGWGAFTIGLRHLDHYRVLFSHDGYFEDASGPANSPSAIVRTLPPGRLRGLRTYLDVGRDDHTFLRSTVAFHATLKRLGVPSELHVFPGGHGLTGADYGWNYIRRHLEDSLRFVGRSFTEVPPSPPPAG